MEVCVCVCVEAGLRGGKGEGGKGGRGGVAGVVVLTEGSYTIYHTQTAFTALLTLLPTRDHMITLLKRTPNTLIQSLMRSASSCLAPYTSPASPASGSSCAHPAEGPAVKVFGDGSWVLLLWQSFTLEFLLWLCVRVRGGLLLWVG